MSLKQPRYDINERLTHNRELSKRSHHIAVFLGTVAALVLALMIVTYLIGYSNGFGACHVCPACF